MLKRSVSKGRLAVLIVLGVAAAASVVALVVVLSFSHDEPPSAAMEPTIKPGTNVWARSVVAVHVGDIVTLFPPSAAASRWPRNAHGREEVLHATVVLMQTGALARVGEIQVAHCPQPGNHDAGVTPP